MFRNQISRINSNGPTIHCALGVAPLKRHGLCLVKNLFNRRRGECHWRAMMRARLWCVRCEDRLNTRRSAHHQSSVSAAPCPQDHSLPISSPKSAAHRSRFIRPATAPSRFSAVCSEQTPASDDSLFFEHGARAQVGWGRPSRLIDGPRLRAPDGSAIRR
jgi:hypothetical protein